MMENINSFLEIYWVKSPWFYFNNVRKQQFYPKKFDTLVTTLHCPALTELGILILGDDQNVILYGGIFFLYVWQIYSSTHCLIFKVYCEKTRQNILIFELKIPMTYLQLYSAKVTERPIEIICINIKTLLRYYNLRQSLYS